jgi:holo-[acyl-carrier protein] synthase
MYVKRTAVMRADDISGLIKYGCPGGENGGHKFFTETEMAYCAERMNCLGARFIIKKCMLDYLACEKGYQGNNYREIEIMNNEMGRPFIRVFGDVRECVHDLKIKDILISISHSKHWVTGMVLFCYEAYPT